MYVLSDFDWVWDNDTKSFASFLKPDCREVLFHVDYSCGTAAVRGTIPMIEDQYYWEIKMTTPVYGTDMVCYEPHHEKAGLWGFQPGLIQTGLYSHRRRLEA